MSKSRKSILLGLSFIVASPLLLGGCDQYLARRDTVSFGAGDSKAHNAAVHIIDPWPRRAFNTNIRTHGSSAEAAMAKYRTGSQGSEAQSGSAVFAPAQSSGAAPSGSN